eukprot:Em0198g1a
MNELKNRTAPDENSVAADLARKANAKATKVKEEEIESHADEDDVVSGWGELEEEVEEKEELSRKWGVLQDDWEAKSGSLGHRPKELTELCRKESPAESVINWDMKRTFVSHTHFKEKDAREFLQKICKAYSVYDPEVGYCQGFSFIIAVLLLQKLPEEEAFTILVKLMYAYSQRDLFKANFKEMKLMFYQLDKVMDVFLCDGRRVLIAIAWPAEEHVEDRWGWIPLWGGGHDGEEDVDGEEGMDGEEDVDWEDVDGEEDVVGKEDVGGEEGMDGEEDVDGEEGMEEEDVDWEDVDGEEDVRENKQEENCNLAQEVVESKVELRSQMDKLEERIDTLSKENKALKTTAEATQVLIKELREELQQSKEDYQKVVVKLTEDQQHDSCVTEYKRAKLGSSPSSSVGQEASPEAVAKELRARDLEMELAQTKLELVSEQCKNQEMQNKLAELENKLAEQQTGKNKKKK